MSSKKSEAKPEAKTTAAVPPAAAVAPAAPNPKLHLPKRIQVRVKKAGDHPVTGAPLEAGELIWLQMNWADQCVRDGRCEYTKRDDHPQIRSGAAKIPTKG